MFHVEQSIFQDTLIRYMLKEKHRLSTCLTNITGFILINFLSASGYETNSLKLYLPEFLNHQVSLFYQL